MEMPMRADVKCADGEAGKAAGVLMNEALRTITHAIVHLDEDALVRRLLPLNAITETTSDNLSTRLTKAEVNALPLLDDVEVVPSLQPTDMATGMVPDLPVAIEQTPKGTLVIDKHTPVEASDGHAGRVDAVLIDPLSGAITHVILREGHLWAKREVTIAADGIASITRDAVTLSLTKDQIGELPATAV